MDPVAPLPIPPSYLVLHKLKQWDDCRIRALNNPSSKSNDQNADLIRKELITMLKTLRHSESPFDHDPNYDPNLHNDSAPRVGRFLAKHNMYGKEWQQMGFHKVSKPSIHVKNPSISAISEGSSLPREGPVRPREKPIRHRRQDLSVMQIRSLAAQTTVAILRELGLSCAIFGSMACKLYGNERIPNVRSFSVLKVHTHYL
jgi:hypothetical protein